MTGCGVQLILSLLVIFCSDIIGTGTNAGSNEINIKLEVIEERVLCDVKVGSKSFKMLLGTWNSGFWLFSKEACQNPEKLKDGDTEEMCGKVHTYDDSKVSDQVKNDHTFKTPYLQGQVEGYLVKENIKIGDQLLKNQELGIVTNWDASNTSSNKRGYFHGYFGIKFLEGNSLFDSLISSKKITKKLYGLYLNKDKRVGELKLGGINPQYISGGESALKDVPLVSDGTKGFLINIDSFKIGTTEVDYKDLKAYVDPGTTYFVGKKEIIKKINQLLGATEDHGDIYAFPSCEIATESPKIELKINNNDYTLDYSTNVDNMKDLDIFCGSTFTVKEISEYDLVFGVFFLNKYYSVFDVENKKIRFAEAANPKK